jgi:5-methylcytosine-specific restriction endonuclease McrA
MASVSPEEQIQFLINIQRLLNEGGFVATYKYALLLSIADLSVELGDDSGRPMKLTTHSIAEKFIEYYWRQSVPFPGTSEAHILRQNTGKQAAVVHQISTVRSIHSHSLVDLKSDSLKWKSLVKKIANTVKVMPLWKLQTIGRDKLEFIYQNVGKGNSIELLPSVAFCFRRFHGLITDLIQGAWIRYVRKHNSDLLGSRADLSAFLFGTDREALSVYNPILTEIQSGTCFYCGKKVLKPSVEVDHFVPWSRYPVDLGHNFVVAHKACNSSKRELLASQRHLENWIDRNLNHNSELSSYFTANRVAHDLDTSLRITEWAYGQTAASGGLTWDGRENLIHLSDNWKSAFLIMDSNRIQLNNEE